MKYEGENGGIVYVDVSDFTGQIKSYGEYHKDPKRCFGKCRKARIVFVDKKS